MSGKERPVLKDMWDDLISKALESLADLPDNYFGSGWKSSARGSQDPVVKTTAECCGTIGDLAKELGIHKEQ